MIINGEERELNKIKIPKGTDVKSYFEERVKQGEYEFCLELIHRYKLSGLTVTKSKLKNLMKISEKQIGLLNFLEVDNPHYKCAKRMKLYLIDEVKAKFNHNSPLI